MRSFWSFLWINCFFLVIAADLLDDVLISSNNIFARQESGFCTGSPNATLFSSIFSSTNSISNWNEINLPYEENVFEIDMTHIDNKTERNWSLRIGKGGQIVSFIVKPGESIANQARKISIWNDLVQQMVAVKGRPPKVNGKVYASFIHGSGVYATDEGTLPPFYNPKLALKCDGNECGIINWGQQAHVPTPYKSPLLFYSRYRDCGAGVIQYDMALYHFGQESQDFDYFNTPWTGVRTSTFPDLLISDPGGKLDAVKNLGAWNTGQVHNLDTTGGFTTFAENISKPGEVFDFPFCVDTRKSNPDHADTTCLEGKDWNIPFQFKVQTNWQTSHTGLWKSYNLAPGSTIRMNLCNLKSPIVIGAFGWGRAESSVELVNDRTGFKFQSDYVIHYCWQGKWTHLSSNVDAYTINRQFKKGDTISVKYVKSSGKPWNAQNALTFVHGKGEGWHQNWQRAKSRLRYGTTGSSRDGTVFTTNMIGRLSRGDVYFARKFIITDLLSNMEELGSSLSDRAFEEVFKSGYYGGGETINLWMKNTSFGVSIGSDVCDNNSTHVCSGLSSPNGEKLQPLFYITCGLNKMTSHDPYYGTYKEREFKKPYKCKDENGDFSNRAEWKLLGFFSEGNCSAIKNREYESGLCTKTSSPSNPPSTPSTVSLNPSNTNSNAEESQSESIPNNPTLIPSYTPVSLDPTIDPSTKPPIDYTTKLPLEPTHAPQDKSSNQPSVQYSSSPSL